MALADGDEVGGGLAGSGKGGDEPVAGGEDGDGVVVGGVAEILFRGAVGGVGGGEASLAGAEGGEEPGVGGEGGDGDVAGGGVRRGFRGAHRRILQWRS